MKKIVAVLLTLIAAPALAQQQGVATPPPSQTMTLEQFMQKSLTPEKQEKLKRAMLGAVLVNCVGQQSGMQPAQAFYQQVQGVGKQVNTDCKSGQADAARTLVLQTIDAHHNDPVIGYLHGCYVAHASDVQMLDATGQQDAAKYDRWMRDPTAAHAELTDADVCHPKSTTTATVTP